MMLKFLINVGHTKVEFWAPGYGLTQRWLCSRLGNQDVMGLLLQGRCFPPKHLPSVTGEVAASVTTGLSLPASS